MKERNLREMGRLAGFAFHEQDMLDVDALRARLTPDTVIVHLAAKAGVRPSLADPVGYARANVTGTAAVLEAARRAGVSRIVFGSSSSVYGDSTPAPFREDAVAIEPVSPYAATKRAGELLLGAVAPIYGFRSAALRFFTVYGPRQRPDLAIHAFARRMVDGRDAHPVRRRHPGARLHVLRRHRGRRCSRRSTGPRPRRSAWRSFNLGGNRSVADRATWWPRSPRALGIEPRIAVGADAAGRRPADGRRPDQVAARVLGYAPQTPFPEGIRRFVAWFREAHGRSD